MSNESPWSMMKKKFVQFCSHCTLHGTCYLSDPRGWLRTLWFLTLICSIGLCCFLSHMIWIKFVEDPTLTVVETTHYSTADIPFPAVVLCDTEPVHGPATANITDLLTLRGYNETQVLEFYESFKYVKNENYNSPAYVKKMHYVLDDLGYPYRKLLQIFSKPCDELILECYWRSRQHNCSQMFRSYYTMKGYCCQFDIPYFKSQVSSETNLAAGVHSSEALDIMVNGAKQGVSGNITHGVVLMYVFDLKDRITLLDSSILLSTGAYFDVNVKLWAIDSSSYVKALDLSARKCILETDGYWTSFYQGCLMRRILKTVVKTCKCIPFGYKPKQLRVEDYSACTWDRLMCIYQEIAKVERGVRDIISQNTCYQRCDYVQYETEVELIQNLRHLKSDTQSRVTVHFSETTCMKYRREVLYTWDQMLANLGGIFGLCLGGSIVSILELIWFTLDLLAAFIHTTINRKKVQTKMAGKSQNKVFVISQNLPKEVSKNFDFKVTKSKKLELPMGKKRLKFVNWRV